MSEPKRPTVVPCPSCQRPVEWTPEAKWRPFCSERCRLIDLGAWMMEQRAIPGEEMRPSSEGEGLPGSPDDSVPRH